MKHRNKHFSWVVWILAFIIINSIIFVLVTATPRFEFSVQEQEETNQVQVSILRTSFFPFSKIEVLLDDKPLALTKLSNKVYSAIVSTNGTLEIKTSYFNGMQKNSFERVGTIDDTPPNVYGEFTAIGEVTLKLEDVQSGINYDAIYAIANDSDQAIFPVQIDKEKEQIVFQFRGGTLEVHIFDMIGNEAISTYDDSTAQTMDDSDQTQHASSTGSGKTDKNKTTKESSKATKNSDTSQNESSASTKSSKPSRTNATTKADTTSTTTKTNNTADTKASSTSTTTKANKTTAATKASAAGETTKANTTTNAATTKANTTTTAATTKASTTTAPTTKVQDTTTAPTTTTEVLPRASAQNSQAPSAATNEQLVGPGANVTTNVESSTQN